jgi:4-hydroxyphenylpyruvate dioxygenase
MSPLQASDREGLGPLPNPLGLAGIEFVEYETARPQALGQALEQIGFRPVARHRSREVLLYRQGGMNIIVNAHRVAGVAAEGEPQIAAIAFRVRDAAAAWRRVLDLGAWPVATQVEPMELNIPAIHGVGASRIYFVDRWREFSIYDVDFVPIPTVDPHPPALAGLGWFGIVQYIGFDRLADWMAFYGELFGFAALPEDSHFGVLNQGRILASPCGTLHWQLIEPEIDAAEIDAGESLHRVALAAPDVLAAVSALRERGVDFVESGQGVRSGVKGALTHAGPHGTSFELVLAPG